MWEPQGHGKRPSFHPLSAWNITAEGVHMGEPSNRTELGDYDFFQKLKDRYEAKEKLLGADAMRYQSA